MVIRNNTTSPNSFAPLIGWIGLLALLVGGVVIVIDMADGPPQPNTMPQNDRVSRESFSRISPGMSREDVTSILGVPHTAERGERLVRLRFNSDDSLSKRHIMHVYKGFYGSYIKVLYDEMTHKVIALDGMLNQFSTDDKEKMPEEPSHGEVNLSNYNQLAIGMSRQEVSDILRCNPMSLSTIADGAKCAWDAWGDRLRYIDDGFMTRKPLLEAGAFQKIGLLSKRTMTPQDVDELLKSVLTRCSETALVPIESLCHAIDNVCESRDDVEMFRMLHKGDKAVCEKRNNRSIFRGRDGKAIVVWFDRPENRVVACTFYDCDVDNKLTLKNFPGLFDHTDVAFPWQRKTLGENSMIQVPERWLNLDGDYFVEAKLQGVSIGGNENAGGFSRWMRPLDKKYCPLEDKHSLVLCSTGKGTTVALLVEPNEHKLLSTSEYIARVVSFAGDMERLGVCAIDMRSDYPKVILHPEILQSNRNVTCFISGDTDDDPSFNLENLLNEVAQSRKK